MTTQAQLSPSKRHRWALCPGSIREEAKYPDTRSGAAAADGTHSHTLLEYCVKNRIDPAATIKEQMADQDGAFFVDKDRAERVKVAYDYIMKRATDLYATEIITESRVDPFWFLERTDLSGTVDIQIQAPGIIEIIDYKNGMVPVVAEDNLQLEQYAIGALAALALPWNTPEKYPWQVVTMTIIQPKMALKGLPPITTWTVPVEQILNRIFILGNEARACDSHDAKLVPGESQCKYCRAKGGCSALANSVMEEVGMLFQPTFEVNPLDLAQQSANKDPATMDDGQIRQIMEAAPLMRQLLEGVETEALRRLEGGQFIPGLKLVHGRGSRSWSLPEVEMAEKLIKMGIPKGAVYEMKLVTPAKAEKLTWEKRDGTKVQLTERQLKRMEQEYVMKSLGKLTVVSESDSRPAVRTDASALFENLTTTTIETLPSWLT